MRAVLVASLLVTLLAIPVVPASGFDASVRHAGGRFGTSTNWAGYAVETSLASPASGAVTDVKGAWVVPAVTCSGGGTSTYSAAWIGIDGYSSGSVEQTGTESDCLNGGATPSYAAWWEMYPKGSRSINAAVHPGDAMTSEVQYQGGGKFVLTLRDTTAGWTFTTTQRANNVARSSAEWVMEAPWSGGVLPLANYGTMTFTGASATLNGHAGAINDAAWQADRIDMVNAAGALKTSTSALDGTGTSFGETWVSST
jgi:hypothetical protein